MSKQSIAVLTSEGDLDALRRLEDQFLAEIGEGPMGPEAFVRLQAALRAGQIVFFLAWEAGESVGMCSVAPGWSTFQCRPVGSLDDFYVTPAHRGTGLARRLVRAAQTWAGERGYASLTVGASPGDAAMYRALGFDVPLGSLLSHLVNL